MASPCPTEAKTGNQIMAACIEAGENNGWLGRLLYGDWHLVGPDCDLGLKSDISASPSIVERRVGQGFGGIVSGGAHDAR